MTGLLAAWSWFTGTAAGRAVLAIGAFLAALGLAFTRGRASAIERERRRAAEADNSNRRTRDAVDMAVAREPDPLAELRADWSRPGPVRPVAPDPGRRG
jgi:hypothetical protein